MANEASSTPLAAHETEAAEQSPLVTFRHIMPDEEVLQLAQQQCARLAQDGVRVERVILCREVTGLKKYSATLEWHRNGGRIRVRRAGSDLCAVVREGIDAARQQARRSASAEARQEAGWTLCGWQSWPLSLSTSS